MGNYKIKVNDEAESKEIQELFFELGYKWNGTGKQYFNVTSGQILAYFTGLLFQIGNDYGQELTLPQLRDLVVLHRNDVKDANCTYQPSGTNEVLSGYLTSDDWYYLFTGGSWQKHISTKHEAANKFKPIQQPEPEQGLISGADALRALADGKGVLIQYLGSIHWYDVPDDETLDEFKNSGNKFRLKPRTITLSLEIPAPFEPKDDDRVWVLDVHRECGYGPLFFNSAEPKYTQFGAWHTEEEIKQVVTALRGIKG